MSSGSNLSSVSDLDIGIKSLNMNSPVAGTSRTLRGNMPGASDGGCGGEPPQSLVELAQSRASDFVRSLSRSPAKKRSFDEVDRIRILKNIRIQTERKIKSVKRRMAKVHEALIIAELDLITIDQELTMQATGKQHA